MCWACFDVDKREMALEKSDYCDGLITPILTLGELRLNYTLEFAETGKTEYNFFKQGLVSDPEASHYKWIAQVGSQATEIRVNFI